jgi:hypothetical protein
VTADSSAYAIRWIVIEVIFKSWPVRGGGTELHSNS